MGKTGSSTFGMTIFQDTILRNLITKNGAKINSKCSISFSAYKIS